MKIEMSDRRRRSHNVQVALTLLSEQRTSMKGPSVSSTRRQHTPNRSRVSHLSSLSGRIYKFPGPNGGLAGELRRASRLAAHKRGGEDHMSFCDHCEGQRFDRAQVLRVLRATRKRLREPGAACSGDQTLALAIEAVRALDIPHLDSEDEVEDEQIVH